MGTDIHGVWQKRVNDRWEDIPSNYEQHRDYQLFAVLADVRNGYGFAGVPLGQSVTPISAPRGLPADFRAADGEHYRTSIDNVPPHAQKFYLKFNYVHGDGTIELSMGDHSHSWLTANEMLEWFKFAPPVLITGIIDRETYNKWDHKSEPESYCGGVYGPDVVMANDPDTLQNWTHIRVTWEQHLRLSLAYFFDEVQRLHNLHHPAEVRFVFGFDS